ncbi:hypothetical protein jhhlp_004753 [Lomentospora prolificans]|uniref:Apple domain-containing protein n=1 Tax=Lomentospora prolificans TaxID=41688 RepID=A0A2N3N8B9_9PEZI|nr:hypothetical protein jhhlp_004753 [Lomentospora prolificans]
MDRTRSTSSGGTYIGSVTESDFPSAGKRPPSRTTPSPSPTSVFSPSGSTPARPPSAAAKDRPKFSSFEAQRISPRTLGQAAGRPAISGKKNLAQEVRLAPQQRQGLIAEEKGRGRDPKSLPEVKAGDVFRPDDEHPSQFTFYREPTPTPSERSLEVATRFEGEEKGRWSKRASRVSRRARFSLAAVGVPYIERPAQAGGVDEEDSDEEVVAILILAGLGAGLGVGLGSKSKPSDGEAEAATTTTPTSPSATTTSPFVISTQPTSEAISCPKSDRSAYNVPGSDKSFLVFCAIDYTEGTQELGEVRASSMEECIGSCADVAACQGCGWGFIEGDKDEKFRCWLKGTIGLKHVARQNWTFALLQQE